MLKEWGFQSISSSNQYQDVGLPTVVQFVGTACEPDGK